MIHACSCPAIWNSCICGSPTFAIWLSIWVWQRTLLFWFILHNLWCSFWCTFVDNPNETPIVFFTLQPSNQDHHIRLGWVYEDHSILIFLSYCSIIDTNDDAIMTLTTNAKLTVSIITSFLSSSLLQPHEIYNSLQQPYYNPTTNPYRWHFM